VNEIADVQTPDIRIYTTELSGANTGLTKPPIQTEMTLSNLPNYLEAEQMKRNETLPEYNAAISKISTSL